jgi:hypothetical protein
MMESWLGFCPDLAKLLKFNSAVFLESFGSVWLVGYPLLVVIVTWGFVLVVSVRLSKARAQNRLREQIIEIGEASI